MKFNIVPLKGKKDTYTKDDVKKNFPKWRKSDFYTREIPSDVNTMMMTGIHPINPSIQIVVLDFDGPSHGEVGWSGLTQILHIMRLNNLEPYMTRITGNCGFHLVYICDIEIILRNEHRRGLSVDGLKMFHDYVGDIDVRGNGGLVFWDCKFTDTNNYETIHKQSGITVTSSLSLSGFVDGLRPTPTEKICKKIDHEKVFKLRTVDSIDVTMDNCCNYDIPEDEFHKFNQLRRAIKDIWTGTYIIGKGENEFREWGVFWRECLARGIPEDVILDSLVRGSQPEFNMIDTLTQLKCLKYKDVVPTRKYYNRVFPQYKVF